MYFFVQQAENHEIDGFEWPQSTPAPGAMSETMCVVFLFPKKKIIFFMKKYFFAFCTTLRLCQSRARSWKSSIFMKSHDFHWFSMIFIDFGQKSWKLMVFDAPGRPPHPVLGQKQFAWLFLIDDFSWETKTRHTSFLA